LIQRTTVNLTQIASVLNTLVQPASNEKRCHRFIKDFTVDLEDIARFILEGLPVRFDLLLDRTEHFFGKTSVNVLTFAACIGCVRIPIIWDDLDKTGNSNTKQRKDLLKALLRVMQLSRIQVLIADREFIGTKWLAWLKNKRVPFVIRIRANTLVGLGPFKDRADRFCKNLLVGECLVFSTGCCLMGVRGYVSATRLKDGELLIVFASHRRFNALQVYAKRWGIECLFKAFRTAGFNLSDSHVTDPARVERLLALMTLALVWAVRVGVLASILEPIEVKSHGRPVLSVFKFGLRVLLEVLAGGSRLLSFSEVVAALFDANGLVLEPRYARTPALRTG
jgi:Transposase DDE domain